MTFPGATLSALNPLSAFGLLLILGIVGGQLARRASPLPTVTGYIITGLIIGPHGLNLVNQSLLDASDLFVQLALGLALYELGRRVDLHWLRREKALLITALLGGALCFITLFTLMKFLGQNPQTAGIIAALALACSPAVLLEILRESHAEGQVSERIIAYAGIGNLLALTGFCLAVAFTRFQYGLSVETYLLQPAWMFLGSIFIGLIAGLCTIHINNWISGRFREAQELFIFAIIALTVGICSGMKLLPALALLVLGLSTRNLPRGYAISSPYVMRHSMVFFAVLFVTAGAMLDLKMLYTHWQLALLLILLRALLQLFSCAIMAHANGLSPKNGLFMGLGLMPMSGTAGVALLTTTSIFPQTGNPAMPLVIAMLCLTEIIGPILTQLSLKLAGETYDPNQKAQPCSNSKSANP